jgi:hypothetical protein
VSILLFVRARVIVLVIVPDPLTPEYAYEYRSLSVAEYEYVEQ